MLPASSKTAVVLYELLLMEAESTDSIIKIIRLYITSVIILLTGTKTGMCGRSTKTAKEIYGPVPVPMAVCTAIIEVLTVLSFMMPTLKMCLLYMKTVMDLFGPGRLRV